MIDLIIKYPTRSRPNIFKKVIKNYIDNLSFKRKIKFIITMDENDELCNNHDIIFFMNKLKDKINLEYYFGNSESKIEACNANIPPIGWKTLLLISDDMIVKQKNYDDIICSDMEKYFPDYDGCLNYNAHKTAFTQNIPGRGSLMVLSIVGNVYYNRFKYIYNPIYKSLFADDEQTRIARKFNKIIDIDNKIISHEWNTINDELRKKCESLDSVDRQTFQQRLKEGLI